MEDGQGRVNGEGGECMKKRVTEVMTLKVAAPDLGLFTTYESHIFLEL